MPEPAQRRRPNRPTAIDMMSNSSLLHIQSTDEVAYESPDHAKGEVSAPCETDWALSSTLARHETVRSRPTNESVGNKTSDCACISTRLRQGRIAPYRGQSPIYVQRERLSPHQNCYGSPYQRPPFDASSDHKAKRLPSTPVPIPNEDHGSHIRWNGFNDHLSRQIYQCPPTSAMSRYQIFHDAYQQHAASAPIEPHATASYPGLVGHINTAPVYQARNSGLQNEHGRDLQTGQTPEMTQKSSQPPLSSTSGSDTHPVRLAPGYPLASNSRIPQAVKYRKLCNNYHLRGACILGNSCRYAHGTIDQAQLKELKRIAKGVVCKYGLACSDELCYAGHKCPYNPCNGSKCAFPPEMHYDGPEDTRGQTLMHTERQREGYSCACCSHYPCDDLKQFPAKNPREVADGAMWPSLQYDEPAALPPEQRYLKNDYAIQREVDGLLDDVATRKGTQRVVRPGKFPSSRETTELELDLFEKGLGRIYDGSPASNPQDRCPGMYSHSCDGKIRATSRGGYSNIWGRQKRSNINSYGCDGGQRRSFRVGKTDTWRPVDGSRRRQ